MPLSAEQLQQRVKELKIHLRGTEAQVTALCSHAEEHAATIRKLTDENAELRKALANTQGDSK